MDDLFDDLTTRIQRRLRGRENGRQAPFAMPSQSYQWSYQWSSKNANGQPMAQTTSLQQQQGQPSSPQSPAVPAPHQNQPQTSIFPELPFPLQNPAQQIRPPTQTPSPRNQGPARPSSSSSSKPPKNSIPTCLTLHNRPRSAQNIPALQWSDTLHHDAQKYAELLARRGKMEHSPSLGETGQGENLYASSDRKAGFGEAVGAWMGEGKWYPKGAKVGSGGGGGLGRWGHYCESF